jgi:peptidoglycan/xylan/chitin deacetylase (PgdA/CDA1 family)
LEKVGKLVKAASGFINHNPAFAKLFDLLEQADDTNSKLFRVLTYHRVQEPDVYARYYQHVAVTPEEFELQMSFLASSYNPISMQQLLEVRNSVESLPPRSVLLTFDDAYQDFENYAWPVLRQYKLPVTLFVPTSFPDNPAGSFWWDKLVEALHNTPRHDSYNTRFGNFSLETLNDRVKTYRRMRDYIKALPQNEAVECVDKICKDLGADVTRNHVMGWDILRQLAKEGVTLGAHTRTHPMMDRISIDQALVEAHGSLQDIVREIGSTLPIFAYPSGHFSQEVVKGLKEIGFKLAFTTERGVNDLKKVDWLRIRRINIGPSTSLPLLRAQLLSWSVHLDRFSAYANA